MGVEIAPSGRCNSPAVEMTAERRPNESNLTAEDLASGGRLVPFCALALHA